MQPYHYHFYRHFFAIAKPVTVSNPLAKGWCVYVEAVDFD